MAKLMQCLQNVLQIIAKLQKNACEKFSAQAIDLRGRSRFPARMDLITTTKSLYRLCDSLSAETFITVDTEFMRESTYWPDLCLIQVAGETVNGLIDPLAPGIDLKPFFALMDNPNVLKVFHAARGHRDHGAPRRDRAASGVEHADRRHGLRIRRPGGL